MNSLNCLQFQGDVQGSAKKDVLDDDKGVESKEDPTEENLDEEELFDTDSEGEILHVNHLPLLIDTLESISKIISRSSSNSGLLGSKWLQLICVLYTTFGSKLFLWCLPMRL